MARRKKQIILEKLKIESVAAEGKSIAHHEEKVIFVKEAVPGDVVDVQIRRNKKSFAEGVPVKYHTYSALRVQPFCDHFGTCGGCKWQHLDYDAQLKYKQQQIQDNFERIAKVPIPKIAPIIPSEKRKHYRNKLEFTFSNKKWLTKEQIDSHDPINRNGLGFHVPGLFDKIVDVDTCHLMADPCNQIKNEIRAFALNNDYTFFDIRVQTGLLRNLIIRLTDYGELMVIVQCYENDQEKIKRLLEHIKRTFPQITSLQYVVNAKGNDTFHDLDVILFSGKDHIVETMGDLKFKIGPKSFYQTNSAQAKILYDKTLEFADLRGDELVYDLYTGTGTIANYCAHKAKKVIGLEYVEDAIRDAFVNSKTNGISNTDFYAGDIKDLLDDAFVSEHGKPEVIITDPPRAGMHENVINMIMKLTPEKVVYVSCNPATQARDVALMASKYQVAAIQPVDMFPHTHHVECICLLELKN